MRNGLKYTFNYAVDEYKTYLNSTGTALSQVISTIEINTDTSSYTVNTVTLYAPYSEGTATQVWTSKGSGVGEWKERYAIGDMISSTELDTEAKVIAAKGGTSWELLSDIDGVYQWEKLS